MKLKHKIVSNFRDLELVSFDDTRKEIKEERKKAAALLTVEMREFIISEFRLSESGGLYMPQYVAALDASKKKIAAKLVKLGIADFTHGLGYLIYNEEIMKMYNDSKELSDEDFARKSFELMIAGKPIKLSAKGKSMNKEVGGKGKWHVQEVGCDYTITICSDNQIVYRRLDKSYFEI